MSSAKHLLLSTRKGLIIYQKSSSGWQYQSTHFLGIPVSLSYVDHRNGTWWACLDHGHWGVKLHRSVNEGKDWVEVEAPKIPEGEEVREGVPAAVSYIWAFADGGKDRPGVLYLGTDPGALFRSDNNGDSWQLVRSLWDHPSRKTQWFGGGRDNPGIHSIIVDPRDSSHLFVGISCAGVFESTDDGQSWNPRNKGMTADFLPDEAAEIGQDPHLVVGSPSHPDVLWNQNHCGIFVSTDGCAHWQPVHKKDGPANFGFAIAVHEQDPATAWVIPGISDQIRVAVDQALCVCRTRDSGRTWMALRQGLPQDQCYDIVYRHGLAVSGDTLVFGTTTGNVFYSYNQGDSWQLLSSTLPLVYAVTLA